MKRTIWITAEDRSPDLELDQEDLCNALRDALGDLNLHVEEVMVSKVVE